jgi:starch synthase
MAHLDVLALPSYAEPFGTVLAEAMAAGTPVVATAVGGLPEVVTDGVDGVLVPPGRPDALAAGILRALETREQLGTNARPSARRFDADGYARRVEALIAP